jgi:hypothetical protein
MDCWPAEKLVVRVAVPVAESWTVPSNVVPLKNWTEPRGTTLLVVSAAEAVRVICWLWTPGLGDAVSVVAVVLARMVAVVLAELALRLKSGAKLAVRVCWPTASVVTVKTAWPLTRVALARKVCRRGERRFRWRRWAQRG